MTDHKVESGHDTQSAQLWEEVRRLTREAESLRVEKQMLLDALETVCEENDRLRDEIRRAALLLGVHPSAV